MLASADEAVCCTPCESRSLSPRTGGVLVGADKATETSPDPLDAGWRSRAVERSLRTARARAVTRSDRFIAAATQLLVETGRTDFTVQDIVERSQMSLRSFY